MSELPEVPPTGAWQLVVGDGSANRWTIDAVGGAARFEFDPVQPHESSTGQYSGGTPAQGAIDATATTALWVRARALLLDRAVQVPDRAKGTVFVRVVAGGAAHEAILEMGVADDLIASLRAL